MAPAIATDKKQNCILLDKNWCELAEGGFILPHASKQQLPKSQYHVHYQLLALTVPAYSNSEKLQKNEL